MRNLKLLLIFFVATLFTLGLANAQCGTSFTITQNGLNILVTNTSTILSGNLADFGDGNVAPFNGATLAHTYNAPGTYTVCILNCLEYVCNPAITVSSTPPQCNADFSFNTTQGLSVPFTDLSTTSSGTITSWIWDFGDGNSSTQQNPVHAYSSAGTYTACLITNSSSGCLDTLCQNLTVTGGSASCQSAFASTTNGLNVNLSDQSTSNPGNVTAWAWDLGDGNSSTQQNPVHTYTGAGTYQVCLAITTSDNCTSTACNQVTVSGATAVPTLSQWGLIFLGLLIMCISAVVLWKSKYQVKPTA